MSTPYSNLERITLEWLPAMRDRDLDRLADLLDPDVEQRWIDGEVKCANRDQLLGWWSRSDTPRERQADAIELRAAGDHVVMAVRGPGLGPGPDEAGRGEVSQLFTFRDGRVVAIRQYLTRAEALGAAGISEENAAWR